MIKTTRICCCDRCGEKMEENAPFWCETHPKKTAVKISFSEWRYADLCDKCKESFKAWWEKSSANSTEAESEE